MLYALFAILALVAFGIGVGIYISAPKYKGNESSHFNGSQFFNPSGKGAQSFGALIKWATSRKPGPWTEVKDASFGPPPPAETHSVRVTFINHSTFLLQIDGVNILTDPVYSERTSPFQWAGPKRMRPPGIRFEDLPKIDYVVISHNHYDHLDEAPVKRLKEKDDPTFITPLGVAKFMNALGIEKARDLDWWQQHEVNGSLAIKSVPAQHFSGRGMLDRDATLWCGYVIERPDGNIYFAGDTGYDKTMFQEIGEKAGPMKLSFLPIGAYVPNWFMSPIHTSPEEAVFIHQDVRSEKSIAMHFGTFPLADDGQVQPVDDLSKALDKQGLMPSDFTVMNEGESLGLN